MRQFFKAAKPCSRGARVVAMSWLACFCASVSFRLRVRGSKSQPRTIFSRQRKSLMKFDVACGRAVEQRSALQFLVVVSVVVLVAYLELGEGHLLIADRPGEEEIQLRLFRVADQRATGEQAHREVATERLLDRPGDRAHLGECDQAHLLPV